ncbi:phosphoglycerate kinase [Pontibaca salina]|uniref:Phosphoglycerate kinase n=1 Tax=Pontibaca salina TaxID=2795731 RepID=A0A934HQT1_9RHOB|nr:phosphoglycerate kinase [Pontibaca salina]MBI6628925.1 phosphoglycerate kinase [Pontibaca salina]
MDWKTLDEMPLADKTVLVRVDLNVPLENGTVSDDTRIQRIVPTIRDILDAGGKPVLLSHFGRPKGTHDPDMSLRPLAEPLAAAVGRPVMFCADCRGPAAQAAVAAQQKDQVVLLENTRFQPGEVTNDAKLAAEFAELGEVYCNDAFSCSHRAHASTEGVAQLLPSCGGRLMEAELGALDAALGQPERPLAALVGGAKVSTKLDLLSNLVEHVDHLIIGGAMANTFLAAQGFNVGTSLLEQDMTDTAAAILDKAGETGCKVLLPDDVVVAREFKAGAASQTVAVDQCPSDAMILDAGPNTVARIGDVLDQAKTMIWNGPLGAFEITPFDAATTTAARKVAERTRAGALVSVAGGGDTVAALNQAGVTGDFSYVSAAGGAFLEWMEGKALPGIAALGKSCAS